ncbi:MAG: SRPBCC family protein [Planctomycetes bacterium]|nr:SRPBCC family protein [Planctomycetota bacterium]
MAVFETETVLHCSPEEAFEFLARPENLNRVTDPSVGLELVDAPERLYEGARLRLHVPGFGPAQELVHEITTFEPPHRFVERQVKGPFQSWVHEHRFEANGDGTVRLIDRVEFEPPGGLLGMLLTEDRIRRTLESSFSYRQRELKRLFEQRGGKPVDE